jgi:hypothetical protein
MRKSIKLNKDYEVINEYHNILNDEIEYIFLINEKELSEIEKFCLTNKIDIVFKEKYPPRFVQIKILIKK